jgi:hypothetical protein
MTSYPETLTVKKFIKMGFFTIKINYISSLNDPNITHTKNHIWVISRTLIFHKYVSPGHYRAADCGQVAV